MESVTSKSRNREVINRMVYCHEIYTYHKKDRQDGLYRTSLLLGSARLVCSILTIEYVYSIGLAFHLRTYHLACVVYILCGSNLILVAHRRPNGHLSTTLFCYS